MDVGEEVEKKRLLEAAGRLSFCSLASPASVPIFWEDAQGYPGPAFSLCSQAGGGGGRGGGAGAVPS